MDTEEDGLALMLGFKVSSTQKSINSGICKSKQLLIPVVSL